MYQNHEEPKAGTYICSLILELDCVDLADHRTYPPSVNEHVPQNEKPLTMVRFIFEAARLPMVSCGRIVFAIVIDRH